MTQTPASPVKSPPAVDPARTPAGTHYVQLPREELQAFVHDLRNGLNSLLMNAGVVAAASDRARFGRFVEQFERDGERCAESLRELSDRYL